MNVSANVNAAPSVDQVDPNVNLGNNLAGPVDGANASGAKSGDVSQNQIAPQMD